MDVLSQPVLILNAGYMPVSIRSVRDAVCMLLLDKAEIIKAAENVYIRSEKLKIPVPHIIALATYHNLPRKKLRVSRQNILERDNFTCVYCGKQPGHSKLTMDHIIPRSRWNEIQKEKKPLEFNSWDNLVTACKDCNTRKGNKLLSEIRWKHPEIQKMSYHSLAIPHISPTSAEKYGWNDYLTYLR